jgi:hypothetical protein
MPVSEVDRAIVSERTTVATTKSSRMRRSRMLVCIFDEYADAHHAGIEAAGTADVSRVTTSDEPERQAPWSRSDASFPARGHSRPKPL